MEKSKRYEYISFLNVISTIAVVVMHTNGCFWEFSMERYWETANIIESVMYFAVPVFFMISGATLMDYRERYSTEVFFRKRIEKTVIPFLVWSVLGLVYRGGIEWTNVSVITILSAIKRIYNTDVINLYWYFPHLFMAYLSIPFFSAVDKEKRKSVFSYIAIIAFVLNSVIPFIFNVFSIEGYNGAWTISVAGGYLWYVIVGYLLAEYELPKSLRNIIIGLAVIGVLMHMIGTNILSRNAGAIVQTYKGYVNVPCILYAIGIFVLFKWTGSYLMNIKGLNSIVHGLEKYTFSIYLMHWFVMNQILRMFAIDTRSIIYRLGVPIIIIGICVLVAFLLRKIPLVRRIVP